MPAWRKQVCDWGWVRDFRACCCGGKSGVRSWRDAASTERVAACPAPSLKAWLGWSGARWRCGLVSSHTRVCMRVDTCACISCACMPTCSATSFQTHAHARIHLFRELGSVDRAVACYLAALNARPNFPQGLNNLAVVYTARGQSTDALRLLQAAIAVAPDYAEAWNNLGVLQVSQGVASVGRRQASLVPARASAPPTLPPPRNNACCCQRDVGASVDAVASYAKCLELDPDNRNAGAWTGRGGAPVPACPCGAGSLVACPAACSGPARPRLPSHRPLRAMPVQARTGSCPSTTCTTARRPSCATRTANGASVSRPGWSPWLLAGASRRTLRRGAGSRWGMGV